MSVQKYLSHSKGPILNRYDKDDLPFVFNPTLKSKFIQKMNMKRKIQ